MSSETRIAWIIDLKKDNHRLQQHLAEHDAKDCMQGRLCVPLSLKIALLNKEIQGGGFSF